MMSRATINFGCSIGLAGMGRRQVRPELRRHHDPNPVFSVDDSAVSIGTMFGWHNR
jgi:hypothetical protein